MCVKAELIPSKLFKNVFHEWMVPQLFRGFSTSRRLFGPCFVNATSIQVKNQLDSKCQGLISYLFTHQHWPWKMSISMGLPLNHTSSQDPRSYRLRRENSTKTNWSSLYQIPHKSYFPGGHFQFKWQLRFTAGQAHVLFHTWSLGILKRTVFHIFSVSCTSWFPSTYVTNTAQSNWLSFYYCRF